MQVQELKRGLLDGLALVGAEQDRDVGGAGDRERRRRIAGPPPPWPISKPLGWPGSVITPRP